MKILVCGHRSFAAQGLLPLLEKAGHDVICFTRGRVGQENRVVSGPVDQIVENPHLDQPFDAVINYILLKDDTVERNVDFVAALLRFCQARSVGHLVHLSSLSSYKASVAVVHEEAEVELDPTRKGSYGALKAATDSYLLQHTPADLRLSLIRPAFILAPGLISPIVGTAARLPWNRLLVIGNPRSRMPLIARWQVSAAIAKVVDLPPAGPREAFLLVAGDSPTRKVYLEACCRELGCGTGVSTMPSLVWWTLAGGGEVVSRIIGQSKLKVFSKLTARLPNQRYEPTRTENRLGMNFGFDWVPELKSSMDAQAPAPPLPYRPEKPARFDAARVTFLGFGRIVGQRHLPALRQNHFAGEITGYDLVARTDPSGVAVQTIAGATLAEADLFVVATPGPAHIEAITPLRAVRGPILVEKPLCYNEAELEQWEAFAKSRSGGVTVCHNYRFKPNVAAAMRLLSKFNPGRLHHAAVHFESPPVSNEASAWARNERVSRTLLMDYSLHYLDIACMFGVGPWKVDALRYELNSVGQTRLIEGHARGDYSVAFLLRQGFGPRRARVLLNFQNYSISLGFFPDTFVAYLTDDNPWLHKREARASRRATVRKVIDKLAGRQSDPSHAIAMAAATDPGSTHASGLTVERVASFYRLLFDLGRGVYEA